MNNSEHLIFNINYNDDTSNIDINYQINLINEMIPVDYFPKLNILNRCMLPCCQA
jgi:hypothetical protein